MQESDQHLQARSLVSTNMQVQVEPIKLVTVGHTDRSLI